MAKPDLSRGKRKEGRGESYSSRKRFDRLKIVNLMEGEL